MLKNTAFSLSLYPHLHPPLTVFTSLVCCCYWLPLRTIYYSATLHVLLCCYVSTLRGVWVLTKAGVSRGVFAAASAAYCAVHIADRPPEKRKQQKYKKYKCNVSIRIVSGGTIISIITIVIIIIIILPPGIVRSMYVYISLIVLLLLLLLLLTTQRR